MSISQYIALIRDALILGGILCILWFIHHADQNAAKVADLQAVEKQLDANVKQEAQWAEEARNAEAQRAADNQAVVAAVGTHTSPVFMCRNSGGGPVSGTPAHATSGTPAAGGVDTGPGENLRPAISAFELKYEGYLSACRSVLREWPK